MDPIFGVSRDAMERAMHQAWWYAGLAHPTFHDERRTAATYIGEPGHPPIVIERILNHIDKSVAAIYNRYSYHAEKRAALEAWEREPIRILGRGDGETDTSAEDGLGGG